MMNIVSMIKDEARELAKGARRIREFIPLSQREAEIAVLDAMKKTNRSAESVSFELAEKCRDLKARGLRFDADRIAYVEGRS